jgi:ribosomal peptide maturation radical SAM protein 1
VSDIGCGVDVAFVVMPFADIQAPAIGVSLLQAQLDAGSRTSRVLYFNIDLAEVIGETLYRRLSDGLTANALVGEWFFADCAFGNEIPAEYEYVSRILSRAAAPAPVAEILQARRLRHDFVRNCAAAILKLRPRIVAFTTTFEQTCACVAVAKAIKSHPAPPLVVFGGANCEGEMGRQLLASVEWIDNVCTGEGDEVFPVFVDAVVRNGGSPLVPGMLGRAAAASPQPDPVMIRDLDSLPAPNFHDYMDRVRASTLNETLQTRLLFQTSRGCWWGAKQHCTFCGLNGQGMAYRSKSPASTFRELEVLAATYGVKRFSSVDNILDIRHIATLFPLLRDSELGLDLFYEVKANLRFDQLALLKAGGVGTIQPGLESLDNGVLRLMRKGCTALQNIQLLRWCKELDITVAWNILGGFPGEDPGAYAAMARLLPLLIHLPPPTACSTIRMDRFSPLFTESAALGATRVRPKPAYYFIFPFARHALQRIAYFFDFDYADGRNPEEYMAPLYRAVGSWWEAALLPVAAQPQLDAKWLAPDEVAIRDSRPSAVEAALHLSGLPARILAACDQARSLSGLVRYLENADAEPAVVSHLQDFVRRGLVIEIEGLFLTLAVMRDRPVTIRGGRRDADTRTDAAIAAEPLLHPV